MDGSAQETCSAAEYARTKKQRETREMPEKTVRGAEWSGLHVTKSLCVRRSENRYVEERQRVSENENSSRNPIEFSRCPIVFKI